ncbi:MAG: ABC transporter permease [Nitrospinae bacterium]|nr:ABC transporter permease [Nitrospinota bacterium]
MADGALLFSKAWGFLQRDLLAEWSTRFSLLLHLLNIGLTVAAYVFLARLVVQETLTRWAPTAEGYFPFVLVGMATNGAMFIAFTGLSRSLQLQQPAGLLKPLLMSQSRPEAVLLLSSLYPLVRAAVDLVVYLLVGWVFGGLSLAQANGLGAAVIACLAIVAFGSLGLCAAAFTVLLKYGNPLLWMIGSSSWLLSGVLYPPALLPRPLRWAAELFPLTHAIQGMRAALLAGASLGELLRPIVLLTAFSTIMVPLGVMAFELGLRRTRVRGTLAEW